VCMSSNALARRDTQSSKFAPTQTSFRLMAQNAILPADKLRTAADATEPVAFRQVPHNIEAEQALLGAMLVNNESLDRVSSFLLPEHFYDPLHAEIFTVASTLSQSTSTSRFRSIWAALPQMRRRSSTPTTTAAPFTTSPSAATSS
jgi:hypothetical protein